MAKARPSRRRAVLHYPSHWFAPEDFLSFIELRPFSRRWDELGLTDKDLAALQVVIMTDPRGSPVIEGTGGVRKLRFVPAQWAKGKSGGLRVCYAFLEEVGTVILGFVYEKGEMDDLTDEQKKILRGVVERVRTVLLSRPYRCRRNSDD
jgi:hypothetical protein